MDAADIHGPAAVCDERCIPTRRTLVLANGRRNDVLLTDNASSRSNGFTPAVTLAAISATVKLALLEPSGCMRSWDQVVSAAAFAFAFATLFTPCG